MIVLLFLTACSPLSRNASCDGYCKGIGYPLGGYAGAFEYVQDSCGGVYQNECELQIPQDCFCFVPAQSLPELTPENPLDANASH